MIGRLVSRVCTPALIAAGVAALALSACSSSKSGGSSTSAATSASSSAGSASASSVASSSAGSSGASSSSGSGSAGNALGIDDTYYPIAVGNTWVYKIDYGPSTLGVVIDTEKVTAAVPKGTGHTVTIVRSYHYQDASKGKDFLSTATYFFAADGSVQIPFGSGVQQPNTTIKVIGNTGIVWPRPDQLKTGQAVTGTVTFAATTSGQTFNASADVTVKGAGAGAVNVPAGSYPGAQILDQTIVEHIAQVPTPIQVRSRTWLVKGIGPVKTTVYGGAGGTTNDISNVLVSFAHG